MTEVELFCAWEEHFKVLYRENENSAIENALKGASV